MESSEVSYTVGEDIEMALFGHLQVLLQNRLLQRPETKRRPTKYTLYYEYYVIVYYSFI